MKADETIRFHVDPRGRILIENFDATCLALALALAPDDPVIRALAARATPSTERRSHGEDRA